MQIYKSSSLNKIADRILQFGLTETKILVLSGLVVGIGAGIGAIIFRELISAFNYLFFTIIYHVLHKYLGNAAVIVLPAIGGLIFGPLIYFFAREAKGHGVPEVMLAVAKRGGRIRPAVAVIKSLASAICIGSGGSVGREGPIVQIGSAIGSTLGQAFRMSDERVRTLVACGAAGGIAATFNAPISGVFFALEVILGEFSTKSFGIVVISSVTASIIGRSFFGDAPSFPVPAYNISSNTEFPLYVILGIIGAIVGIFFMRTLYWFEDKFDKVPMLEYLKPLPGGLILGCLGFFLPQIFGVGYSSMSDALAGKSDLILLVILIFAKILAVSLTIGSGGSGGVFAPSLFIGTMLGTSYGMLMQHIFPSIANTPAAYGLVGMAAVFAGSARAPITAVIILFELTGDYSLILPLMVAVVISTIVADRITKDTIYTLKLRRKGIDLRTGHDQDLMCQISVMKALSHDMLLLAGTMKLTDAVRQLENNFKQALLITDDNNKLCGILTNHDIEHALMEKKEEKLLAEIASMPVETIFNDDMLDRAIQKMGLRDIKQLPVVTKEHPDIVIGIITRSDIFRTYSHAQIERLGQQNTQFTS